MRRRDRAGFALDEAQVRRYRVPYVKHTFQYSEHSAVPRQPLAMDSTLAKGLTVLEWLARQRRECGASEYPGGLADPAQRIASGLEDRPRHGERRNVRQIGRAHV